MSPSGVERPTIFALPALGSGARSFEPLAAALAADADLVAIDLPGFGGRSAADGTTVDEMVALVLREIRRRQPHRWLLLGHSMGGKIASLVAARTLSGDAPLFGLAGVVLLAGSPPSPEPMDEDRRERMLSWTADGSRLNAAQIREFIDGNVGAPLPDDRDALMRELLAAADPEAWTAWLQRGSREDRSAETGVLDLPALVIAGGEDADLGEEAQRAVNGPVYPRARFATLDGAGHLLPLERPDEVAAAIRRWWAEEAGTAPALPADYARMLASSRVAPRTRAALARRAVADDLEATPRALDAAQLARLRVLADLLLPQPGRAIDLAARVDARLAAGTGDGWRNDLLPADPEAYRAGLDVLRELDGADDDRRRAIVAAAIAGDGAGVGAGVDAALSPEALRAWLEDVRVDLVQQWLAHPAAMAAIGYDGVASGGQRLRIQGFEILGLGRREAWEPAMTEGAA
ncbi:alpha/beta fold hydrolase [Pseudolysinimonas sp.]|uniref:alpha/beta fold hydrolase n=1 Tax=Pseudolysinimonas sp. TaxID=2680009 RepID=UPI003F7DBF98